MQVVAQIAAVFFGFAILAWILVASVRTVVVPRPERVWLTRFTFEVARRSVHMLNGRISDPVKRERLLGLFGPAALLILPVLWSIFAMIGYALIFWAMGFGSFIESLELSGSSLTTLGFVVADTTAIRLVAISEGLLGLGIVALMISFIPSLYATFSHREVAAGRFTVTAGEPPSPAEFIIRLNTIGAMGKIGQRWEEWEEWFVELGETHTSFPALIYFRSAKPSRSWLTVAEAALDTAAIVRAADLGPNDGRADTMIRAGFLSLQGIAEFFDVDSELDPNVDRIALEAELSVKRHQLEKLLDRLEAAGCKPNPNRDEVWTAYRGWRINYDRSVVGLARLVGDVTTHWDAPRRDAHHRDIR